MLYADKDGNSYIRVAFRELHLEKNIQMIVFKNLYRIYNFHIFLEQEYLVFIQDFSKLRTRPFNNSK